MRVRATAVLRESTDGRRYLFEVEAWDDVVNIRRARRSSPDERP